MTPNNENTFSPRLAAAIYFGAFTSLFTLVVKYFLFLLNLSSLLPLIPSMLLSLLLGAIIGSLLGKRLANAAGKGRAFAWGALLATIIILLYSLGLQIIYYLTKPTLYDKLSNLQDYAVLYGVLLLFLILGVGIWFIPLTGAAAIHFNQRFFPGITAYDRKRRQN